MLNMDQAAMYRNPQARAAVGFDSPVGEVSEEELMKLAGAVDAAPASITTVTTVTTSSVPCAVFVTWNLCPTTACSRSC